MTAGDGKPCRKCGTSEWYKDGNCKSCRKEARRQWYHANPEKEKEGNRRWQQANREKVSEAKRRWAQANREKENERKRRWKQANPEKVKEENRRWHQANPEKAHESVRRWVQANPEAHAAHKHRRRTRKTGAGGSFTAAEFKALIRHYGGKCLCCGRTDVKLAADHVVPVAKGGSSNIDNIQPLCKSCNSSKGTQTIDYRPDTGLGRWIQKKLFR